jgi:hypothetical protein
MALGSIQLLTEMGTRNLPGTIRLPTRKANNLTIICELILYKMWEPRRLTTLWASTSFYRDNFSFLVILIFLTTLMEKMLSSVQNLDRYKPEEYKFCSEY